MMVIKPPLSTFPPHSTFPSLTAMVSSKTVLSLDAVSERELCRINGQNGEAEKTFRKLLSLSFKHIIPPKHMRFMMTVMRFDGRVLEEKGTVKKMINNVIVDNIWLTREEEDMFRKEFRRFLLEHAKEDGRVVALELFRSMIVGNNKRVIALSADVAYTLISKSTWKLKGDQTSSSYSFT